MVLALALTAMLNPMQLDAKPETYLAEITKVMRADWPGNRTINIVCHGHSVPAGYFVTPRVQTFDSYPHLLHRALGERFPKAVINVTVTAIGGEQSDSGAQRFERDVLDKHPDVVTIDYSLNDRGIGLERAKAAWSLMIESALRANIKVILLTPTPDQSAKIDDPNDPLNQHAEQVRALAKKYGVGLVDSLNEFKGAIKGGATLPSLMSQVNHPNRAGHELVAKALDLWFP